MPSPCLLSHVFRMAHTVAGKSARATQVPARLQAENEVPQPHDLVAWGFTKTKPCCISVS